MAQIVHKKGLITLFGGANVDLGLVHTVFKRAPFAVAADGGAALALAAGIMPEAVIGDLDSLDDTVRAQIPPERIHKVAEQVSTDFDKALRSVSAPVVLGVGFLGDRRDHELANFNVLVRHPNRCCILVGEDEMVMLAPPHLDIDLPIGTRVSLFPMRAVTGRSTGLVWPIDGLEFAPDGLIGTSNATNGPLGLDFDAPGMLLILPREHLDTLIAALEGQGEGWPAPKQRLPTG